MAENWLHHYTPADNGCEIRGPAGIGAFFAGKRPSSGSQLGLRKSYFPFQVPVRDNFQTISTFFSQIGTNAAHIAQKK
jgi:hypothetical protein